MWEIEPHISFSSLLLIVGIKLKEQTIQPSRGLLPSELLSHQLWWEGPDWLRLGIHRWPEMDNSSKFHPSIEMEETCLVAITLIPSFLVTIALVLYKTCASHSLDVSFCT